MTVPTIPQNTATPLDPVTGLLSYITEVKPYHTKVIEVLIQYNYTDALNVTVTDPAPAVTVDAIDSSGTLTAIGFGGISYNIIQSPSAPSFNSGTTAPTSPTYLELWYDTTINVLKQWMNETWTYVSTAFWLDTINLILYTATSDTWVAPASGNGFTESTSTGVYGFGQGGFNVIAASALGPDTYTATTITEQYTFGWGNVGDWFQHMVLYATAGTNTFKVTGNATTDLQVGQKFVITGSIANDGTYTVSTGTPPVYDSTTQTTLITVDESIPVSAPMGFVEPEWFQFAILQALTGTNTFVLAGDASTILKTGQRFKVVYSPHNDGNYTVASSAYDATAQTTAIVTNELISVTETGGYAESEYSSMLNFTDTIGITATESATGDVTGDSPDAWDVQYWDIGGYDGSTTEIILQ